MKKLLCVIFTIAMAWGLVSCSGAKDFWKVQGDTINLESVINEGPEAICEYLADDHWILAGVDGHSDSRYLYYTYYDNGSYKDGKVSSGLAMVIIELQDMLHPEFIEEVGRC